MPPRRRDKALVPNNLRASRLAFGDVEIVVASWPIDEGPLSPLSPAQREVAELVLQGLGTSQIAALRGTSPRTVSKQIDAIYRALGVHSRGELAALCRPP
ncbi:MAG: helix-turn-helix transcriptional regulator [Polyangiaceae bacterium]